MNESHVVALQMTPSEVFHWHHHNPDVRFVYLKDYLDLKARYFNLKRLAEEQADEIRQLQKRVDDFNAHVFGREE